MNRVRWFFVIGMEQGNQRFLKSHVFSNPSQAAAVILGSPTNKRQAWKTAQGKTAQGKTVAEVEGLIT